MTNDQNRTGKNWSRIIFSRDATVDEMADDVSQMIQDAKSKDEIEKKRGAKSNRVGRKKKVH